MESGPTWGARLAICAVVTRRRAAQQEVEVWLVFGSAMCKGCVTILELSVSGAGSLRKVYRHFAMAACGTRGVFCLGGGARRRSACRSWSGTALPARGGAWTRSSPTPLAPSNLRHRTLNWWALATALRRPPACRRYCGILIVFRLRIRTSPHPTSSPRVST